MNRVAALCAAVVLSGLARAESAAVNIHLEPSLALGLGTSTGQVERGGGAALKVDLAFLGLGPLAPQVQGFGVGFGDRRMLRSGSGFGAGAGVRLRLMNDQRGYLIHLGGDEGHEGNLFGNLWLDANVSYVGELGAGFDAALGVELSLFDGLQLGPFAKFAQLGQASILLGGVSLSVGAPDTTQVHDPDRDRDGIAGAKDKCPTEKEDLDGFEDDDGCPERDNDGDGILDEQDKCRNEKEDPDGFEDDDGCPERDNDGDGILDEKDKCPNEKEDPDGFEDDDGCPEADNDGDGIPDEKDKCPTEPETVNGTDDEDGCPEKEVKAFIEKQRIVITEKVFFEFNKARILPKSDPLLRSVAEVLKKFPALKKVRVEGHTDDVGTDQANQRLSERRAGAVKDRLVKLGVELERLESAGFGKTRPLAEGTTEEAREQNRRVEFVIVEPAQGLVPVEPVAAPAGE